MAVWRSPEENGFELLTRINGRARMGVLVSVSLRRRPSD
jgi:hypothetical protein